MKTQSFSTIILLLFVLISGQVAHAQSQFEETKRVMRHKHLKKPQFVTSENSIRCLNMQSAREQYLRELQNQTGFVPGCHKLLLSACILIDDVDLIMLEQEIVVNGVLSPDENSLAGTATTSQVSLVVFVAQIKGKNWIIF